MDENSSDWLNKYYEYEKDRVSDAKILEEEIYKQPEKTSPLRMILKSNWINFILLIATLGSTLLVGAMLEGVNPFDDIFLLVKGIPFSFTLIIILGSHELGHYFASKKHNVKATLPYFIPAPTIFGTFGAFIKLKSPIQNRKALFDIGAAGPLAGFFFTLIAIFYGLHISEVKEITLGGDFFFGSSILFDVATRIIIGPIPPGFDVFLSPIAYAGWIGMIVTAINLMPMGQLDGGHIMYAVFGEFHQVIAKATFITLIFMSFFWTGWLIWAFLGLIMKLRHPKTLNDYTPLDPKRKLIGYLCILIFFISFIPIPIQVLR